MTPDLLLIILNATLALVCLFYGVSILRSAQGGMGGSWKYLVAGLGVFALTELIRVAKGVAPMVGTTFAIHGISEILELVYICLFLAGIATQVVTYRKLYKA